MKISLDSTLNEIQSADRYTVLLKLGKFEYSPFLEKILNNTQLFHSMDNDGTYTLSKKSEKILMDKIAEKKSTNL